MSKLEQYDGESAQSVEFFKIKIMEKDSQISNLQAKLKKIEFKNTRDLKQRKIEIDRAHQLLKQQKGKTDKFSRLSSELKQQNSLLETRMNDIKIEKDKQVESVKTKYNKIKEQVRQYERILPTLSFMNQLGTNIDQLPTYEDIFMNSKEYSQMHEQLKKKHETYKAQTQEKMKNLQKAVQLANQRKSQLQKNQKQIVSKNVQLQNQLSISRTKQQQTFNRFLQLNQQSESMKFQIEQLKDQIKQYQYNIQQMVHNHHVEIKAKDDQLMKLTENELMRYQKEISEMQNRNNQREHSLLNQLSILQEENNQLQEKYRKEKTRYEDMIFEEQKQIEVLRLKEDQMRKDMRELTNQNCDLIEELTQIQKNNQKNNFKIASLERQLSNLKNLQEQYKQRQKSLKETSKETILKVNQDRKELQQRVSILEQSSDRYVKQKKQKENELMQLTHQIQQLRSRLEDGRRVSLDKIPYQLEMRKGSMDMIDTPIKSRRDSSYISLSAIANMNANSKEVSSQTQKNDSSSQSQSENIVQKVLDQEQIIRKLQANQKILEENLAEVLKQKKKVQRGLTDQIQRLKDENDRKNQQLKDIQSKLLRTQKNLQQANQQSQAAKKKMWSHKEQYQKIVADTERMTEQNRKQKESKSNLNKQIRQLKASLEQSKAKISDLQFENKNLKESKERFEEVKKNSLQKEKLYLGENQHYKNQIEKLSNQIGFFSKQIAQKQTELEKNKEQITQLKEKIQKSNEQIAQKLHQIQLKSRQIEMLKQSLTRQRKERAIRAVPSLKNLEQGQINTSQQSFQKHYNIAGQKQAQKYILQREISDLKQQIQNITLKHKNQIESMEAEQNDYIQQIIKMKMKCAEVDLKASEKEYLYLQIKKKLQGITKKDVKQ